MLGILNKIFPREIAHHIYQYASDEMLEKAALPSLIIIIASLLPVFIIYKTF